MSKLKVVIVEPQKPARIEEIGHDLDSMKAVVDGWIEVVRRVLPDDRYDVVCNEEGKLLDLPPNMTIFDGADVICGTFFITKADDEGEFVSLTDIEAEKIAVWADLMRLRMI